MATILPQHWTLSNTYITAQSLQSAALDDVVAMAVLAILSAVYLVRGSLWDRPDPHLYKMFERPQEKMGSNSVATVSRDISERMQQMVRTLSVIFPSDTGLQ
jgi:NADPH-ferrihemoprotein reductase